MTARSRRQTLGQIFAAPVVIGVLSAIGLISALVGDGVWNALSWLTLGVPVALCAHFAMRPR